MKFSDLTDLSRKDTKDSLGLETIKREYLRVVNEQKKAYSSLMGMLESKFNNELISILNSNTEIDYEHENSSFIIKFGNGNISLELSPSPQNTAKYSVIKKLVMKRGDRQDFLFIELSPVFPINHSGKFLESYVDLISEGTELNQVEIQEIKYEIRHIEKNIEVISSSLQYLYYVYKTSKEGNGKQNENEKLEKVLDSAISWTSIFK